MIQNLLSFAFEKDHPDERSEDTSEGRDEIIPTVQERDDKSLDRGSEQEEDEEMEMQGQDSETFRGQRDRTDD